MNVLLITTAMLFFDGYKEGGISLSTNFTILDSIIECKAVAKVFLSMPYGQKHIVNNNDVQIFRAAECVDLTKVK